MLVQHVSGFLHRLVWLCIRQILHYWIKQKNDITSGGYMRIKPSRRFIIVQVLRSSMKGVTIQMVVHFTFIKKKIFVVSNIPEIKIFKK